MTIKNESSYDIENVKWNNENLFGLIAIGSSIAKPVSEGKGYVYFTRTVDKLDVRTAEQLTMDKSKQDIVILNSTLVVEIANSDNKKTLNTIETIPPIINDLML